jgi:hypothetical protein
MVLMWLHSRWSTKPDPGKLSSPMRWFLAFFLAAPFLMAALVLGHWPPARPPCPECPLKTLDSVCFAVRNLDGVSSLLWVSIAIAVLLFSPLKYTPNPFPKSFQRPSLTTQLTLRPGCQKMLFAGVGEISHIKGIATAHPN